jgi:cation:H+ antiporter
MLSASALPSPQKDAPMASLIVELAVMFVIILLASELFTNALEHLGAKLRISEGVTGSLFAAVGTALPETIVPLLAISAGTTNIQLNEEVGVGAILGAPLMLSTLSTCLMAIAVVPTRGASGFVDAERSGFIRDLDFFLLAFAVAATAMFVPEEARYVRGALSATLVVTYFVYILLTVRASGRLVDERHGTRAHHRLFLS